MKLRSPHLAALAFCLFLHTASAHAQGCSQCLDQTQATPPSVQAGYRHAIELMASVAAALFVAGAWLLRREP